MTTVAIAVVFGAVVYAIGKPWEWLFDSLMAAWSFVLVIRVSATVAEVLNVVSLVYWLLHARRTRRREKWRALWAKAGSWEVIE